jgi:pimeloyl-ACP methyl ester carboxylesterase
MVASAALLRPALIKRLVLLSPARGYGDAPEAERDRVRQGRLDNLQKLGPRGMADARAAAMLTPDARSDWLDAVRETMAQVNPAGYTQAIHMLVGGRLIEDVRALHCPIVVASGAADTITPPQACDAVAQAAGVTRMDLGSVGHACSLQAADAVNALLELPASHPCVPMP